MSPPFTAASLCFQAAQTSPLCGCAPLTSLPSWHYRPASFSVWLFLPRPSGNVCLAPGLLAGLWILSTLPSTKPSFKNSPVSWRKLAYVHTGTHTHTHAHTHKLFISWEDFHYLSKFILSIFGHLSSFLCLPMSKLEFSFKSKGPLEIAYFNSLLVLLLAYHLYVYASI